MQNKNMTIRELINKKLKKSLIIQFVAWGIFLASAIGFPMAHMQNVAFVVLMVTFIIAYAITIYFFYFYIRCPKCKQRLTFLSHTFRKKVFAMSDKINFCPYCGINFDTGIIRKK